MTAPSGSGAALGVMQSVMTGIDKFEMSPGAGSLAGFFGTTAITQPTNANQAALTVTTGLTGGVGFTTTTGFSALIAQVENIRASLVALGLLKGS